MLDTNSPESPSRNDDTFVEQRAEARPSSGEAPFEISEVFFSRTDPRGVIQAANYIFMRVSGFEWSEIEGAPHKIVRHPNMPRGVFQLLWDTIKAGKPIGAYVLNRAKDGLDYWVFASMIPVKDGYLSVRFKPSSPLFDVVKEEYARLLELEKTEGLSPEESAAALLSRLAELGFASYLEFESHAITEELLSRSHHTGDEPDAQIVLYKEMHQHAVTLKEATETLVREFEAVQIIPHNMRVMASRLEPTGGPFNTLSSNYGAMSSEMSDWFATNVVGEGSNFATISDSVNRSMFNQGMVHVLRQCDRQLKRERRMLGDADIENERQILDGVVHQYTDECEKSRAVIADEATRIGVACKTMARHVLGLSTTRVMCKIESARMAQSGEGIADIIGQLGRFQEKIGNQLQAIEKLSEEIQSMASRRDPSAPPKS